MHFRSSCDTSRKQNSNTPTYIEDALFRMFTKLKFYHSYNHKSVLTRITSLHLWQSPVKPYQDSVLYLQSKLLSKSSKISHYRHHLPAKQMLLKYIPKNTNPVYQNTILYQTKKQKTKKPKIKNQKNKKKKKTILNCSAS